MKIKSTVLFRMNKELAIALNRALKPDNEQPPKGFSIRSLITDKGLLLMIDFSGMLEEKELLTFLSIVDEISRLIELFANLVDSL